MSIVSAENRFRKGLEALVDQDYVEAAMHFRQAMDIEHQRRILQPDMRYLSYYGLSRATAYGDIQQGLHACRRAVTLRVSDPAMFLNLGRVQLLSHDYGAALEAFRSGLAYDPRSDVLLQQARRAKDLLSGAKKPAARRGGFLSRVRSAWSRPASSTR